MLLNIRVARVETWKPPQESTRTLMSGDGRWRPAGRHPDLVMSSGVVFDVGNVSDRIQLRQ